MNQCTKVKRYPITKFKLFIFTIKNKEKDILIINLQG